jgi:hypothetical protein
VTDTDLDESLELLKRALAGSPGRTDLVFMMAQLYLRKEDFKTARQLIDKLKSGPNDAEMRQRVEGLLAQVNSVEQLARIREQRKEHATRNGAAPTDSGAGAQPDAVQSYDPSDVLRESLRQPATGETQTQAVLMRIDCDSKGITFVLKVNDRLLKLSTDSFQKVDLKSYSEDAGRQITCGPRKPENNVVVSYIAKADSRTRSDGFVKSIEFVPPDFKLKP